MFTVSAILNRSLGQLFLVKSHLLYLTRELFTFTFLARYTLFGSCSATAGRKYLNDTHISTCVLCAVEVAATPGDPVNE